MIDDDDETEFRGDIVALRQSGPDERFPASARVAQPGRTQAGTLMNPDRALRVSACWAASRFLAQTVARLPWNVKRTVNGGSVIQSSHQVNYLLETRVSPEWTSQQLRETLMWWVLRWGNAYAEIERSVNGTPIALWPLHPSLVVVSRDLDTGELFYRVSGADRSKTVDIPAEDVFHLKGLGESVVGLNVMAYAAESIGWTLAAQIFGAGFFRNSANPSGVVQCKRALTPEGMKNLRDDFRKLYTGGADANKVVFLDADMEYKPVSTDPEKSQFIETNQFLLDEVARWFGLPPHKIYNLLRATFSNIEAQTIEVVDDSITPWALRFENEANEKLLGANRRDLWTDIDLRAAFRADTVTRMAYYQGMRNIGALNVNEIRAMEGLNSIGPQGELYTIQSAFASLETLELAVERMRLEVERMAMGEQATMARMNSGPLSRDDVAGIQSRTLELLAAWRESADVLLMKIKEGKCS